MTDQALDRELQLNETLLILWVDLESKICIHDTDDIYEYR